MKQIKILDLKPTQFAIGMLEVDDKVKKYKKMPKAKIKQDVKKHPVCIVIAPNGEQYIIDGHHRALALWLLGFRKVPVEVKKDFRKSAHSFKEFWKEMNIQKWSQLHDQFGDGPRDPIYLPKDIRAVSDDPYRSLAWLVREQGGFKASKHWFTDFEWSNFFRKNKVFKEAFDINYNSATRKALKLAKSSKAKKLPGYIGPKNGRN